MREIIRLSFNKRFRKIILMFVSFMMQFWWLNKLKRFYSAEIMEQKYKKMYKSQAETFTNTAIHLGGLLIKLGQFFSSRVDILPKEYTDQLSKLQDSVKPVDTEIIKDRVQAELGKLEEHFSSFSENALAAASLGQVHLATLQSGEKVAVKVLRPGIEEIIDIDIEALKRILDFAKRNKRIKESVDLDQIYSEFTNIVLDELDYEKEGLNADTFRDKFMNDSFIKIPKIYWELSTKKVLTMEYMQGAKITDFNNLTKDGVNLEKVAERLFSAYLEQIMNFGIFHADPHPGNLLVDHEGNLIFLDFGMVDIVESSMKKSIIDLAVNVYKKDSLGIVTSFDNMGFLRPHADKSTLIKGVKLMLANMFKDTSDVNKVNIEEVTNDLRALMYSQPFQIPAGTLFLGKALITIMGICKGLNKDFDMVKAATPYVKNLFGSEAEIDAKGIVLDQAKKVVNDIFVLPGKISNFIDGIQTGEIRLQPAKSFENTLLEQQAQQSNRITLAVLASGLTLSGSILLNGSYTKIGTAFLVLGSIFIVKLLRSPKSSMRTGFKKPRLHP